MQTVPIQISATIGRDLWPLIFASAAGNLIEWYDFFIFGSLISLLSSKFYPPGNELFAYVAYLITFAVGFVARPFGSLVFGGIGDAVGRKYAFLATLSIMGGATAAIGLLPTFKTAGWFAPITLIFIRLLQGLAVGGEYGGAAVYVAEHVGDTRRGFYTSFVQATGPLGLCASLAVVWLVQQSIGIPAFNAWGWRVPFLLSVFLAGISLFIRSKMKESPIFLELKRAGRTSRQPLKEVLTRPESLKQILITLFGATAACAVVGYTSNLYPLFYLQTILRVDQKTVAFGTALALLITAPFGILFGFISDKIGRKRLIMAACLLGVLTYIPIYKGLQRAAGNNVVAVRSTKDEVTSATKLTPITFDAQTGRRVPATEALNPNVPMLVLLLSLQGIYGWMIYSPMAAYLVELFPARVRYTSLSVPYHIGFGVFGGFLPLIGLAACAATGNIYAGLYYPISIAVVALVVGGMMLKETLGVRIWDEVADGCPRGEVKLEIEEAH